jgi:hypothetical protein
MLDTQLPPVEDVVHILNPFDPLIIQRKRLALFFGYDHRFEAYVPKDKRVFGYFSQPVLVGDEIVAVLDLKTDRERGKVLIQKWTWLRRDGRSALRRRSSRRCTASSVSSSRGETAVTPFRRLWSAKVQPAYCPATIALLWRTLMIARRAVLTLSVLVATFSVSPATRTNLSGEADPPDRPVSGRRRHGFLRAPGRAEDAGADRPADRDREQAGRRHQPRRRLRREGAAGRLHHPARRRRDVRGKPSLYKKLPFDPDKDFRPITLTARFVSVLVVNPDKLKVNSVADLIAAAKAEPGKIDVAHAGVGNPFHLAAVLFQQAAGIKLNEIPIAARLRRCRIFSPAPCR